MSALDRFHLSVQTAVDAEIDAAAERMRQSLVIKLSRQQGRHVADMVSRAEKVIRLYSFLLSL